MSESVELQVEKKESKLTAISKSLGLEVYGYVIVGLLFIGGLYAVWFGGLSFYEINTGPTKPGQNVLLDSLVFLGMFLVGAIILIALIYLFFKKQKKK